MRRFVSLSLSLLTVGFSASVLAADVWTDPAPGVRQLVRTVGGPNRLVGVVVDLGRPEFYIRVTRPGERAQTTSAWAAGVGAVVAINGDFFDYNGYQPVGLTVGDGEHWEGTRDSGWSFMACTIEKTCTFDDWPTDTALHHRWHDVIGGNGWRLLIDGNIPAYPADAYYTQRHPRSGVGVSADGKTMIFGAVEGRRGDSIGMGFAEFAQFFKDLGAHQALMLDGGGSTALVVNGTRVSRLPSNQGSERVVANHLGIVRGGSDPRCAAVPNGRTCQGSVIHTCRGGAYRGSGDCAAFGASCEVTPDGVGTCVHPYCTGGANGRYCENETEITTCDYGVPGGTGDCSAFGATCETGADDAYCVHFLCTEGGNATWCRDEATLATCVDGQPLDDVDCAAAGQVCLEGACVEETGPSDPAGPDMGGGGGADAGNAGVGHDETGGPSSNGSPDAGFDDGPNGSPDAGTGEMDGRVTEGTGRAGCCATARAPEEASWAGLAAALMALTYRRRRSPTSASAHRLSRRDGL